MRLLRAVIQQAVRLLEEEDDVGRIRQVLLHVRRLEKLQIGRPLLAHPLLVVDLFLGLDDSTNFLLQRGLADDDISPGLGVGPTGRRPRRPDDVLDHLSGDVLIAEEPQRPSLVHRLVKRFRFLRHFLVRQLFLRLEFDVLDFRVVDGGNDVVLIVDIRVGIVGGLAAAIRISV